MESLNDLTPTVSVVSDDAYFWRLLQKTTRTTGQGYYFPAPDRAYMQEPHAFR